MDFINEPEFTVDYFINKFEAIAEELWITNDYTDGNGRFCAYGHCGATVNRTSKEAHALGELLGLTVSEVNDGRCNAYQQPTPKQRILAALYDIKNKHL